MRRLLLLLALLTPAAGLAQTAGNVLIVPAAFGPSDCNNTTDLVTIAWTSSALIVTGDKYKVYVNNASTCPASAAATGTLVETLDATLPTQTLGTLTRAQFITASTASCLATAADSIIYVCVQHVDVNGTVFRATATGSAPLNLKPPPVPEGVTAAPGDSALYVSWVDGPSNGVAAATYEVTAETYPVPDVTPTRIQSFTGRTNNKVSGLVNGVEYQVTVKALAAGSSPSAASLPAYGTPEPVSSFWDQYQEDGGREQGGCAGGPAGVLSLLGVALALRGLRRRS